MEETLLLINPLIKRIQGFKGPRGQVNSLKNLSNESLNPSPLPADRQGRQA
jgi:hypothetical protein